MNPSENLRTLGWIATIPILLIQPALACLILRFGLHLPWLLVTELSGGYLLAEAVGFAILWRGAKRNNKYVVAGGAGVLLLALAAIVYVGGQKAGLIATGVRPDSIITAVLILVFGLLPVLFRRKTPDHLEALLDCARCGHFHEFKDCRCGCRADQFRYRTAYI